LSPKPFRRRSGGGAVPLLQAVSSQRLLEFDRTDPYGDITDWLIQGRLRVNNNRSYARRARQAKHMQSHIWSWLITLQDRLPDGFLGKLVWADPLYRGQLRTGFWSAVRHRCCDLFFDRCACRYGRQDWPTNPLGHDAQANCLRVIPTALPRRRVVAWCAAARAYDL